MEVIKRTGLIVPFDKNKIKNAIVLAFRSTHELHDNNEIDEMVNQVFSILKEKEDTSKPISIEKIQNYVEETLMYFKYYKTAKAYIIYRYEHAKIRPQIVDATISELAAENAKYFDNDLVRQFVYLRTYARWIPSKNRREVWSESVQRYMDFMFETLGNKVGKEEYQEIQQAILKQEVMPSMRLMQFAGDAARRCNVCVYNCSYTAPRQFKDLADLTYLLMSGVGVGFSVEAENVNQFPTIAATLNHKIYDYVIEDSKEGWADSLLFGLEKWYEGSDVIFDYSKLRPAGARLKTMGGRSSGPEPLKDLHNFTRETIQKSLGKQLTSLQLHDIICKIGQIVVSGGTRRSSLISLSDLKDKDMRGAKSGPFWVTAGHRSLANNSAVYTEKPSMIEFMNEWLALAESGTGERGIFNRGGLEKLLPQRRLDVLGEGGTKHMGVNPCVTGDTWVLTVEGPMQVKDLVGKKIDLIVNGKTYAMESEGFFSTGAKEVFKVTTSKGYQIKCTGDHPLLMHLSDTNYIWVKTADLRAINKIALSNHRRESISWKGTGGTFDEGFILGHYAMCKYGEETIAGILKKYPTLEAIEATSSIFQTGYLNAFFTSLELKFSKDESVENRYAVITLVTFVDEQLLQSIQRMLLRFGVVADISQKGKIEIVDDSVYWFGTVKFVSEIKTFFKRLGFHKILHEDFEHAYIPEKSLKIVGDKIVQRRILRPTSESIDLTQKYCRPFRDTITSIVSIGIQEVFDVTVNHVHEFCADGIRASNCGEILLKPMEFCNLTEVICRSHDTEDSLMEKIKIATILGTYQSCLTKFNYISPEWVENQKAERLLGVSLTGQWDCPIIRDEKVLEQLRLKAVEVNKIWSQRLGINQSTAVTTCKPSGSVSQVVNSASGIHPRFAPYYIRRVRISATDPLFRLMKDQGFTVHPEVGQSVETATTYVLEFPVKAPEGAICVKDVNALEQLNYVAKVKKHYTEHNTSVTINVKNDEWLRVGQWVWDHWDMISGLSFFPFNEHIYALAPYEEISQKQYEDMVKNLPQVDFGKLVYYEIEDATDVKKEIACSGGICEL